MNNELEWNEFRDDWGNQMWESNYAIEYGGVYRIVKRLRNDKVVFVEDSTECMRISPTSPFTEQWNTLGDAKYDIYRHHLASLV